MKDLPRGDIQHLVHLGFLVRAWIAQGQLRQHKEAAIIRKSSWPLLVPLEEESLHAADVEVCVLRL